MSSLCYTAASQAVYFTHGNIYVWVSLVAQTEKNLLARQETRVQSLGWEDPLERRMATHVCIFARRIPRTEEADQLQSMGSQRVGHNRATNTSPFNVYVRMLLSLFVPRLPVSTVSTPCSLCPHLYSCPADRFSEVRKRKTGIR